MLISMVYALLLVSIFLGLLTGKKAQERGRSPYTWFAIGLLFGLLGFITLYLFPPLTKQEEGALQPYTPPPPPTRPEHWYYLDKDQKSLGPISLLRLKELLEQKTIDQTTYIWSESLDDWRKVEEMNDSFLGSVR